MPLPSLRVLSVCVLLACGLHSTASAQSQAGLYSWGLNDYGQLGIGLGDSNVPVQVQAEGIVAFGTGYKHTLAVRGDGVVLAWGSNEGGQLGNGTTTASIQPSAVPGLTGAIAVSGGERHSLALRNDGTVWIWGLLGNGFGSQIPVQVQGLTSVVAIASGYNFNLALKADGTVWSWGRNDAGQLGNGSVSQTFDPVQVLGLSNVRSIAAGYAHGVALRTDGSLWLWGWNHVGQLGDGTSSNRPLAGRARIESVKSVAAYWNNTVLVRNDGTVWHWGETAGAAAPLQVEGLSGTVAVAAGYRHGIALDGGGTVWSWGRNEYGQLGDGTHTSTSSPVRALDLSNAVAIRGGYMSTFALTTAPAFSLDISISAISGCQTTTGTIALTDPAPAGGAQVLLSSTNRNVILPASIIVAEGARTATFQIGSSHVQASEPAVVIAQYRGGTASDSFTLTPIEVESITLDRSSVDGGGIVVARVQLVCPAGPYNVTIGLGSSNMPLALPFDYMLPVRRGTAAANVVVSTGLVSADTRVTIFATAASVTRTAQLTITP